LIYPAVSWSEVAYPNDIHQIGFVRNPQTTQFLNIMELADTIGDYCMADVNNAARNGTAVTGGSGGNFFAVTPAHLIPSLSGLYHSLAAAAVTNPTAFPAFAATGPSSISSSSPASDINSNTATAADGNSSSSSSTSNGDNGVVKSESTAAIDASTIPSTLAGAAVASDLAGAMGLGLGIGGIPMPPMPSLNNNGDNGGADDDDVRDDDDVDNNGDEVNDDYIPMPKELVTAVSTNPEEIDIDDL
jgi:hypothetical protein